MSENATWKRRRAQEEKDARERRTPVYGSSVGAVYALRTIAERVSARAREDHAEHDVRQRPVREGKRTVGYLYECAGCGRSDVEIDSRRARKRKNGARARRRRFHKTISRFNAARAAR